MRPVFGGHWSVESDKACDIVEISQQRGDVAVTDKNLGMAFDLFEIKFSQEIIGAVATARADDRANVVTHEHLFQLARSAIDRTGEVKILVENGI
jgi:hypothetical protein